MRKEFTLVVSPYNTVSTAKTICRAWTLGALMLAGCLMGVTPEKDAKATNTETETIINAVETWFKPYQTRFGLKRIKDADTTHILGNFGILPTIFNTFSIAVSIDSDRQEVLFVGYLPTTIPPERRQDMIEFLFRGEEKYGLSTASMVLDNEGSLSCQAWMPFESFTLQPEETTWRLMGAVIDKLLAFSNGTAMVALGGNPAEAAATIKRKSAFDNSCKSEALRMAADADSKIVLERCFDENANITDASDDLSWKDKFFRGNENVKVGIIHAHFEDIIDAFGGVYDELKYSFVVKEGMVWNVCEIPETIPKDKIHEVADLLMRLNEGFRRTIFGVDFDMGKIWCQYALPVASLPGCDENPPRNSYAMYIKLIPIHMIAQNSKALHSIIAGKENVDEPIGADGKVLTGTLPKELVQQAWPVASWLKLRFKNTTWQIATNETGRISVQGTIRKYSPIVEAFSLTFDLDRERNCIVCKGELSDTIPASKHQEAKELLSLLEMHGSMGNLTIILNKNGKVQCTAAFPLQALHITPNITIRSLASSVTRSLLVCADGVTRLCKGGKNSKAAAEAASCPVQEDWLEGDSDWDSGKFDELVESWLDSFQIKYKRGIESETTVYYLNRFDTDKTLSDCLVLRGDTMYSQCRLNLTIPENRRKAVHEFALHYNASHPEATIRMGCVSEKWDSVYFQCETPLSVFKNNKQDPDVKNCFQRMIDLAHLVAVEISGKLNSIVMEKDK